jgi:hypothetical protein
MVEKLGLPFSLLSDPRGELARRCDLWNDKEGVAVPAIVVVDQGGIVRYLYKGDDFADRPGDEEVFDALDEALGASAGVRYTDGPPRSEPPPTTPRPPAYDPTGLL